MFDAIAREIRLDSSVRLGEHIADEKKGSVPVPFSRELFHALQPSLPDTPITQIMFVDGGNAEIFGAPNISLHIIRVCAAVYSLNRHSAPAWHCTKRIKDEFFLLAQAEEKDSRIIYRAKIFPRVPHGDEHLKKPFIYPICPICPEDLTCDSFDQTLAAGAHRAAIARLGDVARRLAEFSCAASCLPALTAGALVVLDGSLEAGYFPEARYLANLYAEARKQEVAVLGLSKTTTLLTNTSMPVGAALDALGPQGAWWYHPLCSPPGGSSGNPSCGVEFCYAKLHKAARHVFRIDGAGAAGAESPSLPLFSQKLLGPLALMSNDMTFPGYPYGLIRADQEARVTNQEKNYYQALLMAKIGKPTAVLEAMMHARDAHEILDSF